METQEIGSRTHGKYEIVRPLGAGGMAEVLLARQVGAAGFEKLVALKRLLLQRQHDHVLMKSLINEARLASQLSHPNVVQVFDFEIIDQSYCLVMEFIDGLTLEDTLNLCRVQGIRVPPGLLHYIAVELCAGLSYLHMAPAPDGTPLGLVHRDIKPSNIMLAYNGQVKLLDFGVAKATTNLYRTTVGGGAKGTLAFMSPEQLSGEAVGPTSDLFSLGVTLFESSTLVPLFDDRNLVKHTQELYLGLRPDARALLSPHTPALVPIVEHLIRPNPVERFQTALEVRAALRPLLADHGSLELAEWLRTLVPAHEVLSPPATAHPSEPTFSKDRTLAFDSASEAYLQSSLLSGVTTAEIDALTPSLPGAAQQKNQSIADGSQPTTVSFDPVDVIPGAMNASAINPSAINPSAINPSAVNSVSPASPDTAAHEVGAPPPAKGSSVFSAPDAQVSLSAGPSPTTAGVPATVRNTSLTSVQKGLLSLALVLLAVTLGLLGWRYSIAARANPPVSSPAHSSSAVQVSIQSDPPGTIYIGGRDRGGHYQGFLPPGRHPVLIQTAGGKQKMFIIDAKVGQALEYIWSFHEDKWLKGRD